MCYPDMKDYITFLFFSLMSLLKENKPLSAEGDRESILMLLYGRF